MWGQGQSLSLIHKPLKIPSCGPVLGWGRSPRLPLSPCCWTIQVQVLNLSWWMDSLRCSCSRVYGSVSGKTQVKPLPTGSKKLWPFHFWMARSLHKLNALELGEEESSTGALLEVLYFASTFSRFWCFLSAMAWHSGL